MKRVLDCTTYAWDNQERQRDRKCELLSPSNQRVDISLHRDMRRIIAERLIIGMEDFLISVIDKMKKCLEVWLVRKMARKRKLNKALYAFLIGKMRVRDDWTIKRILIIQELVLRKHVFAHIDKFVK